MEKQLKGLLMNCLSFFSWEKRTSLKIACPEEIALHFGWITREQLQKQIEGMKGKYFEYLQKIALI
jgi:hypothetical protein